MEEPEQLQLFKCKSVSSLLLNDYRNDIVSDGKDITLYGYEAHPFLAPLRTALYVVGRSGFERLFSGEASITKWRVPIKDANVSQPFNSELLAYYIGLVAEDAVRAGKLSRSELEDEILRNGAANAVAEYLNFYIQEAGIEKKVFDKGSPCSIIHYCFLHPDSDIKAFEDKIVEIGEPRDLVYFATCVNHANVRRLRKELVNTAKRLKGNRASESRTGVQLLLRDMSTLSLFGKLELKLLRRKFLKTNSSSMRFSEKYSAIERNTGSILWEHRSIWELYNY